MDQSDRRRQHLEQLLSLAQAYRGWTRKDLAEALGRDPTKLVPLSGVPKLDVVVALAKVLDWPVQVVIEALWCEEDARPASIRQRKSDAKHHANGVSDASMNGAASRDNGRPTFEALDSAARTAHREGRYAELVQLARQAFELAETGDQRATACNREAGGWDGLGRYSNLLDAVQRGLRQREVSPRKRLMLQANLANAYYCLWQLIEARATADDLIERLTSDPPQDRLHEVVHAFAYYVRGNSHRRMIEVEPEREPHHAAQAHEDLSVARERYLALADAYEDDSYRGIANTCLGGLHEAAVQRGEIEPDAALELFAEGLDAVIDPGDLPVGDWLESYGWWCIFACNIALRHITDERILQQRMALFTNKADEIAQRLDHWAMRERVFTLEFARRQRLVDWTGVDHDWTIDAEDVRTITGTMGRFPAFHDTGWRILRTARLVQAL